MKKFRFKFQQLLDLRKLKEEEEINKLYSIQQRFSSHKRRLNQLKIEKVSSSKGFAGYVWGDIGFSRYHSFNEYLLKLDYEMEKEQKNMDAVQADIARQQRAVIEAKKQRMVLDKLRDKYMAEYKKDAAREEQMLLDEAAISGFLRNKGAFQ